MHVRESCVVLFVLILFLLLTFKMSASSTRCPCCNKNISDLRQHCFKKSKLGMSRCQMVNDEDHRANCTFCFLICMFFIQCSTNFFLFYYRKLINEILDKMSSERKHHFNWNDMKRFFEAESFDPPEMLKPVFGDFEFTTIRRNKVYSFLFYH